MGKKYIIPEGTRDLILEDCSSKIIPLCEGYDLYVCTYKTSGQLYYDVFKDDKKIIVDGITSLANYYEVYHEVADEIIDNKSVQKVK